MIKIVTDSSADISAHTARKLGITVVPIYVRFGDKTYRDKVDIKNNQFYRKLLNGSEHPVTIQPGVQDFVDVYRRLSLEADGIISIHISDKLSGTYSSALHAKSMVKSTCPIKVIDSGTTTVALGLICITAAEAANGGTDMRTVSAIVDEAISGTHSLGVLDTLKYLDLGGRIGKAKALAGSVLNVKPLLSLRNGEIAPVGRVRSRAKGIQRLFNFARNAGDIEALAIAYNTNADEARSLFKHLSSWYGKRKVKLVRLGTSIGVHTGPGTLIVALRAKVADTGQAHRCLVCDLQRLKDMVASPHNQLS